MSRVKTTKALTDLIYKKVGGSANYTTREVSIIDDDYVNHGRVDFVVYDQLKIWRFYEIKSCKEDFYSDAKWTFMGHYNYFILPYGLYEIVKDDIPPYVGVYEANSNLNSIKSIKRARKQTLGIKEDVLLNRFIVSLCRDADRYISIQDDSMNKQNKILRGEINQLNRRIREAHNRERYEYEKNYVLKNLLINNGWTRKDILKEINQYFDDNI